MKIGLFFGSFNPVHTGHLIIAEYVTNNFTDKVWFVVSPQNPFKELSDLLNVQNRILLVKTAISDNSKFEVSDAEMNLPLPSFTIDTLNFLKKNNPEHEFFLIIGSDNFLKISGWKSSDILLNSYKVLIYNRPGFNINSNLPPNIIMLDAPYINIASTEIRKLIKSKKDIRYIVPDPVISVIRKNNFYS